MDDNLSSAINTELQALKPKWGWLLLVSILFIITGIYAISYAVYASIATVFLFGILLLCLGVFHLINSFISIGTRAFALSLLFSLIYIFAGIWMIAEPMSATITITFIMVIFFIISGIIRIITAIADRGQPNWGFVLFSGIIALILGIVIWAEWPVSGLWVIGLFVGIEFILAGWTLLTLALAARSS